MNPTRSLSRRGILLGGIAGAAGLIVATPQSASAEEINLVKHDDPYKGLKVGCATYTYSKFKIDEAIKGIVRTGLTYCSIKDVHIPFKSTADERKAGVEKFKAAGITPLSIGNVSLKNDEADMREKFEYARDIGIPVMVCSPERDALPLLDKFVKEFNIKAAIHNHGPEDAKKFPSPYDVITAVEKLDSRIGCCIDVGHSARAGADPVTAIEKIGPRVYDIHMKDLQRIDRRSIPIECGRGVLDIKGILAALIKIKFEGHVGFEHEKDMNDPTPGLAENIGYLRGVLGSI